MGVLLKIKLQYKGNLIEVFDVPPKGLSSKRFYFCINGLKTAEVKSNFFGFPPHDLECEILADGQKKTLTDRLSQKKFSCEHRICIDGKQICETVDLGSSSPNVTDLGVIL